MKDSEFDYFISCLADYGAEVKPCESGEGGIYVKGEKVDITKLLVDFFSKA